MNKRSEQDWRDLFTAQVASGISAQQFCKANGLCPKHFSVRKQQLGLRGSRQEKAFVRVVPAKPVAPVVASTPTGLIVRHEHAALAFETLPPAGWLAQFLRALA